MSIRVFIIIVIVVVVVCCIEFDVCNAINQLRFGSIWCSICQIDTLANANHHAKFSLHFKLFANFHQLSHYKLSTSGHLFIFSYSFYNNIQIMQICVFFFLLHSFWSIVFFLFKKWKKNIWETFINTTACVSVQNKKKT